jgi:hypothetical protein
MVTQAGQPLRIVAVQPPAHLVLTAGQDLRHLDGGVSLGQEADGKNAGADASLRFRLGRFA